MNIPEDRLREEGEFRLPDRLSEFESSLRGMQPTPLTFDATDVLASAAAPVVNTRPTWLAVAGAWVGGMVAGALLTLAGWQDGEASPPLSARADESLAGRDDGPFRSPSIVAPATGLPEKDDDPAARGSVDASRASSTPNPRDSLLAATLADPFAHGELVWRGGRRGDLPTPLVGPSRRELRDDESAVFVEPTEEPPGAVNTKMLLQELLNGDI